MENKGKTSGAYSFGVYDSDPYILMNFKGTLKDIFTLVHEGGHSMHSWYTRKTQPYIYGEHSIFTAEVASTVNETLLIHYLLQNTDSRRCGNTSSISISTSLSLPCSARPCSRNLSGKRIRWQRPANC